MKGGVRTLNGDVLVKGGLGVSVIHAQPPSFKASSAQCNSEEWEVFLGAALPIPNPKTLLANTPECRMPC